MFYNGDIFHYIYIFQIASIFKLVALISGQTQQRNNVFSESEPLYMIWPLAESSSKDENELYLSGKGFQCCSAWCFPSSHMLFNIINSAWTMMSPKTTSVGLANAFLDVIEVPATPEWIHINSNAFLFCPREKNAAWLPLSRGERFLDSRSCCKYLTSISANRACVSASRNSVFRLWQAMNIWGVITKPFK